MDIVAHNTPFSNPFKVCGIYSDVPFFIYDVSNLCFLSVKLVRGLLISLLFSKNQVYLIFFIDFLYSSSLISALFFYLLWIQYALLSLVS